MADRPLTVEGILRLLPHRYPMLLVDRVLELSEELVVAEKLVTANEPFFQGHFPERPIMPGVLIIEALAQAAALWVLHREPQHRGRGLALVGIDDARFRRPVVPGDALRLTSRFLRRRGDLYQFEGTATVAAEKAAEARVLAAFVDWEGGR